MASIIQDIDTVREYATVAPSMHFDNVKPHINYVTDKYIIPLLGQTLYDAICPTNLTGILLKLQNIARRATANLALYEGAKGDFQVTVGDGGIRQAHSEELKPAFERNIRDYRHDKFLKGYEGLDDMLAFLYANKDDADFLSWKTDKYSSFSKLFIRSGKEFAAYYPLVQSYYLFNLLQFDIESAEDLVKDTLKPTLFATVKTEWQNGSIAGDKAKLIPYIQSIIAHRAIATGLRKISVAVDERGITLYQSGSTDTTEQATPASEGRIERLIQFAVAEADKGVKYLANYLQANANLYTEYTSDPAYNANAPETKGDVSSTNGNVVIL